MTHACSIKFSNCKCSSPLQVYIKGFSPSDSFMKISVFLPVALLSILAAASSAPSQGKGLWIYILYTDERGGRGNEQRSNALVLIARDNNLFLCIRLCRSNCKHMHSIAYNMY